MSYREATIPSHLAKDLWDRLHALRREQLQHNAALSRSPIPAVRELRTLLDVAFASTLEREEGRPVDFRLAFLRENTVRSGSIVQRLESPVPLSSEAVRRLAPATDPDQSALVVEPGADGLTISAIAHGPHRRPIISFRTSPPWLEIRRTDIGGLSVILAGTIAMEFGHGRARFGDLLDHTLTESMIAAAFPGAVNDQHRRVRLMMQLASRMDSARHGGTILVAADPPYELATHVKSSRRSVDPLDVLGPALAEIRIHQKDPEFPTLYIRPLMHALDQLARLTAIDGALLLNQQLEAVAFGVMLQSKSRPLVSVSDFGEPASPPGPLDRVGGGRHQSAVQWVWEARQPAIALVASQDGGISLVKRTDEHVAVTQRIVLEG